MNVKIYNSTKNYNILALLKESFHGFKDGLFLSRLFVVRGFLVKYKTSYLGLIWEMVPSLTTACVWIFLRESGTVETKDISIPFPLFVIIGTTVWSLITESINKPIITFIEYSHILSKINIPKEALLLIGLFNILINNGIKLVLIVILLIYYNITPSITFIYFIPILILVVIFFMIIGVFLMPIEYMLPDFSKIKNYFLTGLMYLTPVVYANPGSGFVSKMINLNPLTNMVDGFRNALTGSNIDLIYFLWLSIITVILFFFSLIFYRVTFPIITERIGS